MYTMEYTENLNVLLKIIYSVGIRYVGQASSIEDLLAYVEISFLKAGASCNYIGPVFY